MAPLRFLVGGLLTTLSIVEATVTCTKNSSPTTLAISYTADGTFVVAPQNFDNTGSDECFIRMTSWNGDAVSVELHGACNTGTFTQSFTKTSGGNNFASFAFGKAFSFKLLRYTTSSKTAYVCESTTYSITPALCRGGSYALSSLSVLKRPYMTIGASVSNKPLSGDCVYYLTQWAGSAATDTVTKTDCSGTSFSKGGFAYGVAYTVKMINFAASANIVTDQPVCGINPVEITPVQSSATLTVTDIAYGVIKVSISGAGWSSKCEVSLQNWNGVDRSSLGVKKSSLDCTSVTFSAKDVGYAFGFGASYSFEMAEYALTDTNTGIVNPRSTTSTKSQTISTDSCAPANLVFDRLDPVSVGVSITSGKPYAACRVTLTEYDGTAKTMVRVGLCSSYFRFTADGDVWFQDSKTAKFKYDYYPDGDISGTAACSSTEETYSISLYQCGQTVSMSSEVGRYVFSVASPQPMIGNCKLLISNCAGSSQDPIEISLPSCASSLALTYSDLVAEMSDLAPGTSCDFNWKYYNGSTSVCAASGSSATATIVVPLTVSQTSLAADSITVSMTGIPTELTAYLTSISKTKKCYAWNAGCNGAVVGSPTKVEISGCSGSVTLTADMTANDNCVIEVAAYASNDLNTVLGYSGSLSLSASGVPEWGADQIPLVTLYGDNCMQVSWEPPETTGGAPILCYEVQRKDASGSFYGIRDCTIGDTSLYAITCGFTQEVSYQFQVIAINRNGRSADMTSVSVAQQLEFLQSAPDTVYVTPASTQKMFVAGAFPAIIVHENNPTSPLGAVDNSTIDRLYVATLVSRCKLDATGTVKVPLTDSDGDYTAAVLPIPPNSPPAFTEVFDAVQGSPGVYRLIVTSQPPAGAYSTLTYSLESGGLGGQYWSNPFFSGSPPTYTRKDPLMNFTWGMEPIINSTTVRSYDLVSVRWTGFIEAAYTETYTFFVEANNDQVRLWIDDVIVINKWESDDLCHGVCTGNADLQQSSSTRKFSSIRIDFVHSKGPAQAKPAQFALKWVSFSQALEVIPVGRLFKALPIQSSAKTITVIPGQVSASACTFALSSQSFNTDKSYNIIIHAKDSFGNVLQSADSEFKASFTGAASQDFTSVALNATLKNGIYTIPFKLPTAGVYSVAITELASGNAVSGSPISLTVTTGAAYAVANPVQAVGTHYADSAVSFSFDVQDENGNVIDGSALTTMPAVHVSALWPGDSVTQSRLPVDDVAWRSTRFGTLFTNATITWSSGKFRASILLPRAGVYTVDFSVDGGAAPVTVSPVTVVSGTSVAAYAVVVSTPFPPTDMASGVSSTFTVQLRDQFMNAVSTALTGSPTVLVGLQKHPTANNQVACSASSTAGQYDCTITPQVSGSNLALSLLVDGVFASYIHDTTGSIMYSRGPWYVNVTAGAVSGAHSVLTGVRKIYVAGVSADATLLLRDAYNNNLGAVSSWPTISAVLTDGGSTTITMDTATFKFDAGAGIVTIPIVATQQDTGLTLVVTVDGVTVPLPYGIGAGEISIIEGVVNADATVCAAYSTGKAGSTFSSNCLTKDSQSNAITWANLNAYTTFVHTTDSMLSNVVAHATVNGGNSQQWDLSTTSLTKAGSWWYYTMVAQPGGLIAQYYGLSSFSSLIGISGTPLSNVLSGDVSPTLYTQIDQFLDFDLNGPIIIDDTTALSVTWVGMILSPISGADAPVTFNIVCTGGVRVQIGATDVNLLTASSVDETFNVTMSEDTYYTIQVDYIPDTTAALTFTWTYTGAPVTSQAFVVPPSALHAVLNVESTLKTVTVDVADVSIQSTASFSSGIVAGQADFIIVQATDQYGNDFTTLPACLSGVTGTAPACLFVASLALDDGSTFGAAVDLGDGTIKLPVTFATDGPKSLHVKLKTSGGNLDIQGSPYTITVNPAR